MAADQSYAHAQFKLGFLNEHGLGVPRNRTEAMKWYRLAADQGGAVHQFVFGIFLRSSRSNATEAMKWFRLAADQGHVLAHSVIGTLYKKGNGVPKDYVEAMKWYRLAADQGGVTGQLHLGEMYDFGWGVPQNYVQAHMWYNISASRSDSDGIREDAIEKRDEVATKMTPAQIAKAQKLASEWQPQLPE